MKFQESEEFLAIGISPFCQITGKKIKPIQCGTIQGNAECFGCAAITRACELCKSKAVDVPAVGLCSNCLLQQLKSEVEISQSEIIGSASCKIFRKTIDAKLCLNTQGQSECFECSSPTRLCEKCGLRVVKYPIYGYCTACTIDEYGEGWNAEDAIISSLTVDKEIVEQGSSLASDIDPYMPDVRNLLQKFSKVSVNLLAQNLGIKNNLAKRILNQCAFEGLVTEEDGTKPRTVLIKKSGELTSTNSKFSKPEKIAKLRELIRRLGPSQLSEIFESIIDDLRE